MEIAVKLPAKCCTSVAEIQFRAPFHAPAETDASQPLWSSQDRNLRTVLLMIDFLAVPIHKTQN